MRLEDDVEWIALEISCEERSGRVVESQLPWNWSMHGKKIFESEKMAGMCKMAGKFPLPQLFALSQTNLLRRTMNHHLRLLVAGVLALPALLVLVVIAPIVAILSIPSLAILVRRKHRFFIPSFPPRPRRSSNSGTQLPSSKNHPLLQHAVITGGSSGIGLSIAIELARRSCQNITLIARNADQLADAKRLIEEAAAKANATATSVFIVSVDVTNFAALEKKSHNFAVVRIQLTNYRLDRRRCSSVVRATPSLSPSRTCRSPTFVPKWMSTT